MKIEKFLYGQARIVVEPTPEQPLRIEADVNINDGKVVDVNNGRVLRIEDETPTLAAEFSSYAGATHLTWFGVADTDAQIELVSVVNSFCSEVREQVFSLVLP